MLTLEGQAIGVRRGLAAAGTLMLCLSHPAPAPAASTTVLALELNEGPGASTAIDSSGRGHHGAIGSHLVMDGAVASFDRHSPTEGVAYRNEHLIVVPDAADASLDPGRGNFTVEVRFASSVDESSGETPNLLQKGYSNTPGGQAKLQFNHGRMRCTFATSQGAATVTSPDPSRTESGMSCAAPGRRPLSPCTSTARLRTGERGHRSSQQQQAVDGRGKAAV